MSPLFRGQSPDAVALPEVEDAPLLIGDVAVPWGLNAIEVKSIALVNGLDGTGSDPPPTPQRDMLYGEMQTHKVKGLKDVLASDRTSMVYVVGILPPGVQKGDRFDVEVRVPPRSETTSLRGGWLMPTRLREMQILGNALRKGHVVALAKGRVLDDAIFFDDGDSNYERSGRVLGGGISGVARTLGLVLRDEHSSIRTSTQIGRAINARFHHFVRGSKKGVATPKEDDFIELALHPRYKFNMPRYIRVIRSLAFSESPSERLQRIEMLGQQLLEPISSRQAALQLEAIGKDAVNGLKNGLVSDDDDVRFYAAEALAYLDESEAAEVLAESARSNPKYRPRSMLALTAMNHLSAYDALTSLLDVPSAEMRYGAFEALRRRNPNDPHLRGKVLNDAVIFHRLQSSSTPFVHFSRTERPEIVVFGDDLSIEPPSVVMAGKQIMIHGAADGQLKVSRYSAVEDTKTVTCEGQLDALIRAIAEVGGGYAEILEAVQSAKRSGDLSVRVVIDNQAISRRKIDSPDESESNELDEVIESISQTESELEPNDEPGDEDVTPTKKDKAPIAIDGSEPDFDSLKDIAPAKD